MVSLPVRNALHLGQTSILPVLLVLVGLFTVRGERTSGVLIGIAAALQPTVLLFAALLWLTGRRRAALTGGAAFAACTALAWAAMPHDSWTYWVHHVAGAGLGDQADSLANQSLHGALLRLGLEGPLEIALFVVLAAAVCFIGLRRAAQYARDGQLLLAVAVTGCVCVAVAPTAWQHQLLWVLLAVVGRVGKRASDRLVWPAVVILVVTLPGKMLLPNIEAVFPVRDNVLLIAALAAACVAPFLPRTSPYWQHPVPTAYAAPVASRWSRVPLAPFWRRVLSRPNLLLELLLIRVVYSAYQQVRLAATAGRATAEHHGRQIHSIEQWLHIDIEHWVNHSVVKVGWLRDFFDYYYSTFHFIVPLAILGVLYVQPARGLPLGPQLHRLRHAARPGRLLALPAGPAAADAGARLHRHRPRRPGLREARLRHADRGDQPVRGDALAALRLVAVVRCGDRDARPEGLDEGAGCAAPAVHGLDDRRDRQPLGARRGRRGGGGGPRLRPHVRALRAAQAAGTGGRGAGVRGRPGTGGGTRTTTLSKPVGRGRVTESA